MDGLANVALTQTSETRWFDDFFVGERFVLPARTLGTEVFHAFADASGEAHPLHTDSAYCAALGIPGLQASALLVTIQTTAGAGLFPFLAEQAIVGLVEQSSRYVRSAYAGDTLSPVLQVSELIPGKVTGVVCLRSTVHNQRRELVLEGSQRWLVRKRAN